MVSAARLGSPAGTFRKLRINQGATVNVAAPQPKIKARHLSDRPKNAIVIMGTKARKTGLNNERQPTQAPRAMKNELELWIFEFSDNFAATIAGVKVAKNAAGVSVNM